MSIKQYQRKRNFSSTPEPQGGKPIDKDNLIFVVQKHAASRLHYDFRVEAGGVLKSWAVPKGPSLNSTDQRLAVHVEDHPMDYAYFEGIIPKGNYGAGTVMIWDFGHAVERNSKTKEESEAAILRGLEKGHVTLLLEGSKLNGEFALVRTKKGDDKSWLLIKKQDREASYKIKITDFDRSVATGRSMEEISEEAAGKKEIWHSGKGRKVAASLQKKMTIKRVLPSGRTSAGEAPALQNAKKSNSFATERLPRGLKPMIAVRRKEPFQGKGWFFEPAVESIRVLAEVEGKTVRLLSKQGLSLNRRFVPIVQALQEKNLRAVLDGEIIVGKNPVLLLGDLLHLDGSSTRKLTLRERKALLKKLSFDDETLRLKPYEENNFEKLKRSAAADLWSGKIIAKDSTSFYEPGVSKQWLEFPVEEKDVPKVQLTNLDKILWPKDGYKKFDLVEYYRQISPILLPHLKDRPESLHRHPNGIEAAGFFQKDLTGYLPKWVETHSIYSSHSRRSINYALCQNHETLLYLANLGCIELNPWLSRVSSLDVPDFLVIDLDPDDNNTMAELTKVAQAIHKILEGQNVSHYVKTSGATGLHICVPTGTNASYDEARHFALSIAEEVHKKFPKFTSLERSPAKRRGRIYLDCFQNARGQTIAAPYCLRPRLHAPVAMPLDWNEVNARLRIDKFNIRTAITRVEKKGDLWKPFIETIRTGKGSFPSGVHRK